MSFEFVPKHSYVIISKDETAVLKDEYDWVVFIDKAKAEEMAGKFNGVVKTIIEAKAILAEKGK